MPSLTRDDSMLHLMALIMSILVCYMGLVVLQTLHDKHWQSRPPSKPRKTGHAKDLPPPTENQICNFAALPTELLLQIFEYLASDKFQLHLDSISLDGYKQAQKDLRNVCLVSRQMVQLARLHLYHSVIVYNVDVLAYFLRTLDEDHALGQHVKRLVFQVPLFSEDTHYRKPDVAVLESRPNYSDICALALEASDVSIYERYSASTRKYYSERNFDGPVLTFTQWESKTECQVLGLMYFELLLRTKSLESLSCGMATLPRSLSLWSYYSFVAKFASATGIDQGLSFMSKLHELQLSGDGQGPYSALVLKRLLGGSSLRVLKSFHDDGSWYHFRPGASSLLFLQPSATPPNWQYKNITRVDLQRSHCKPPAVYQICNMFPSLEHLSVSTEYGESATEFGRSFSEEESLSAGLAKLTNLQELVLDLHYTDGLKAWLGPHGVLNLASLSGLISLRLPLHFLVEMQSDRQAFITDLSLTLPACLKQLTVWADMDTVRHFGFTIRDAKPLEIEAPYHPRESALNFLDLVSGHATSHFKPLKEVTYCYSDRALGMPCRCGTGPVCDCCLASHLLDPRADPDSSARMQTLSSRLVSRGVVCLCTPEDQNQDG